MAQPSLKLEHFLLEPTNACSSTKSTNSFNAFTNHKRALGLVISEVCLTVFNITRSATNIFKKIGPAVFKGLASFKLSWTDSIPIVVPINANKVGC